jgi:hypothetical protein
MTNPNIPDKCQCEQAGNCPLLKATMSSREHQYCQGTSGLSRWKEEYYLLKKLGLREEAQKLREANKNSPNFLDKAINFAKAATSHALAGFKTVPADVLEARLSTCETCDRLEGDLKDRTSWRCRECGCGLSLKANWQEQRCPLDKWKE